MRLGPFLLAGAALAIPHSSAQERPALAWERVMPLAWGIESVEPPPPVPSPPAVSTGPQVAQLTVDGTLRILDERGRILLKTGLPGRPLRAWRDGGVALPAASGSWGFPLDSPLTQGLGTLQWSSPDFRPFLRGLLWVLEDSESFLSVIHPATARVIHLPLPPGRDLQIRFLPDRLDIQAGDVDRGAPRRWSIPWMGLFPRLSDLGPQPTPAKPGTALVPFPKD